MCTAIKHAVVPVRLTRSNADARHAFFPSATEPVKFKATVISGLIRCGMQIMN